MRIPITALSRGDLKNVFRDSTLVMALFGPVAIFSLLLGLPLLESLIYERYQFDLAAYRLVIVTFLSLVPSMLFGMIFGFIILDERDEDIIDFISVTPLQKEGYLTYKLQMPMLLSIGFFLFFWFGTSLVQLNPLHASLIGVMVALEAAIGTLFLVTFSENKVEGLAFSKLLGILYLGVPVVILWESSWHWFTAWLPSFWVAKAILHSQTGVAWVWADLTVGLILHCVVLIFFLKSFLNSSK